LKVSDVADSSLVITKRFMLADNKLGIDVNVKQPAMANLRMTHHEIDFNITTNTVNITDPFEDLKVFVLQNHRWDNALQGLKPIFIKDNQLVYDLDRVNSLPAGKEFRRFDIRSFRIRTEFVSVIETRGLDTHITLSKDNPRSYRKYFYERDFNGKYVVEVIEGNDPATEADYAYVHFTLPMETPITTGNLYVFGALSNWNADETNQLVYNYEQSIYAVTLFLKQGFYNYAYVYVEDGKEAYDLSLIEGNHYEAENDYIIYVYHRQFNKDYDELIGVRKFNSLKK
ncbi:MAG: DUF5103 domain-containing protein, partial [Bacteroidetes bacterium]|nr:DUF5103 domain-containing protein [Bacteroidota bacterium]